MEAEESPDLLIPGWGAERAKESPAWTPEHVWREI